MGGVDMLINNAGLGGTRLLVEMTDEEWARVLDITLTGTMRMTRAMLRKMQPRGAGVIVNNASVLGWRAQKEQCHYAAAKAGVMALTRCAALEAADLRGAHQRRVALDRVSRVPEKDHAHGTVGGAGCQRGFRPRRGSLGGGQCDDVPGLRLRRLHDRRSGILLQPARLSAPTRSRISHLPGPGGRDACTATCVLQWTPPRAIAASPNWQRTYYP